MYFPKSQIKTNLYTNGGEFTLLGNKSEYIGSYYSTSTGKFYAGKNPNSGQNTELVPFSSPFNSDINDSIKIDEDFTIGSNLNTSLDLNIENPDSSILQADSELSIPDNVDWESNYLNNEEYNSLVPTSQERLIPLENPTTPTVEELSTGKYVKYYAKDIRNVSYYEISKKTFKGMYSSNLYATDLYDAVSITFLTGKQNNTSNHLKMISVELKYNWKGFAETSPFQNNQNYLVTNGGEFLLPNRKNYIGFYHIHNNQFMIGKVHKNGPQTILIPLKSQSMSTPLSSLKSLSPTPNSPSSLNSGGGSSGGGGY